MLKKQRFGVEIEMTGLSRGKAADTLAELFGTSVEYVGEGYHTRDIKDTEGRTWKVMRDGSIDPQPAGNDEFKVEVVSPILEYKDLELIQSILRALKENGAKTNSSCGIHVHIDGANHNPQSLRRLVNFMYSRQDLIYEALEVKQGRMTFCKKLSESMLKELKSIPYLDVSKLENTWYSKANDNYSGGINHSHYNQTRYHCLNLHSFFSKGTVEFRLFNSTTHAGKLKAYIQFCLAVSAWSIESTDNISFRKISAYTAVQKATIMNSVLINRLGLSGEEFKTCRYHFTNKLKESARQIAA